MAEGGKHLADEGFLNWLKAVQAFKITKTGLEDDVEDEINKSHAGYLTSLLTKKQIQDKEQCTECFIQNILPCPTKDVCKLKKDRSCAFHDGPDLQKRICPKNICNRFTTKIWKDHRYKKPSWKNTNIEKWCQHPWEIAKCFMPREGYNEANSIKETDLNGILSVIHNHKSLAKKYDLQLCVNARNEVNAVRHLPNLSLEENKLTKCLDTLIKFVGSCNHPNCNTAKQRLEKLKSSPIFEDEDMKRVLQSQDSTLQSSSQTTFELLLNVVKALTHETSKSVTKNIMKKIEETRKKEENSDEIYKEKKQDLHEDLLDFNEKHHSTLALSPIYDKKDTPLIKFYVPPTMMAVDIPMGHSHRSDIKTPLKTLKDLFKERRSGEIYVTSKAGLGKTAFCKRLVVAWCHYWKSRAPKRKRQLKKGHPDDEEAIKEEKYYEGFLEDVNAMKSFKFLFFIRLRDALPVHCDVDEMIHHQVIRNLSREKRYDEVFIQDILTNENCLVIVDGLDEWTHPRMKGECKTNNDIPHRKARHMCTIVSTTRTWKYCTFDLSTNQVDLHAQISELEEQSSKTLIQNALSALADKECTEVDENIASFHEEFRKNNASRFKVFPMILMFFICLWKEGKSFGNSLSELYSNIVGLLVDRVKVGFKRAHHLKGYDMKNRYIHDIPKAIACNETCLTHVDLLTGVGHLAFDLFFNNERKENSLVFDKTDTDKYPLIDLQFCIDAGILCESSFPKELLLKPNNSNLKVCFAHKTFQEFFAALYVSRVTEFPRVLERILSVCSNVTEILSCYEFFVFLSGLSPDRAQQLGRSICKIITDSEIARNYRKYMGSWNYFVGYNETIKKIQSLFVECNTEASNNKHDLINFLIEDIIIDTDFHDEQYSTVLKKLIDLNRTSIKSIKMRDMKTKEQFHKSLMDVSSSEQKQFSINQLQRLEKIDLKCEIYEEDLENVLEGAKTTLKCFIIKGGRWFGNKWDHKHVTFSNRCHQLIWNMHHLEELYLRNIKLTHRQLENLINSISNRRQIKHLGLGFIQCTNHGEMCPGVQLDMSNHPSLKMIELGCVSISAFTLNVEELEVIYVGDFRKKVVLRSIFQSLKQANKLRVFCCGFLSRPEDIEDMFKALLPLHNLQHVWLAYMTLGQNWKEHCDSLQHVENIYLMNINLKYQFLVELVDKLEYVAHTVRVGLSECDIQPKAEFNIWKTKVVESKHFKVLQDDIERNTFIFRTFEL